MLEVPSLLYQLDELLERVDFLSVGSNDLLQFLYAADRGNTRVADRFDPLSAPVLRALKDIVDKGEEHDKPVTLCGELASKPIGALALVALGYRSLSLSPSAIGPVKAMVLDLDCARREAVVALDACGAQDARSTRRSATSSTALCRRRRSAICAMLPVHQTRRAAGAPRRRRGGACRSTVGARHFVKLSREFAELAPVVEDVKACRAFARRARRSRSADADPATDAGDARHGAAPKSPALEARRERARAADPPSRCCRRMRWTSATSSWKSAPAPAATKPRCSPATCSACTSATPPSRAGRSK